MILVGDAIEQMATLPAESIQCVVTSPPYLGLRKYGEHEMCVVFGSLDDFPISRKHPERWWIRIRVRAVLNNGVFSRNGKSWIGMVGLESTPELYLEHMTIILREVRRVLRQDGTLWLNMGDSYSHGGHGSRDPEQWPKQSRNDHSTQHAKTNNGLKPKNLIGMPWRLALALQADGWYLRSDIIWSKPNPMPESCRDRPTSAHEHIFLLTKSPRYFYDAEAVKEPAGPTTKMPDGRATHEGDHGSFHRDGREKGAPAKKAGRNNALDHPRTPNPKKKQDALGKNTYTGFNDRWKNKPVIGRNLRNVWTIATQAFPAAHFATFPEALAKRCLMAGTSAKGACPDCGAPWARVLQKDESPHDSQVTGKYSSGAKQGAGARISQARDSHRARGHGHDGHFKTPATTGWQPTCECGNPETVPCVVLDPFAGSGTVGKVAIELGLEPILIELNPEYVEMIKQRTETTLGMGLDI